MYLSYFMHLKNKTFFTFIVKEYIFYKGNLDKNLIFYKTLWYIILSKKLILNIKLINMFDL